MPFTTQQIISRLKEMGHPKKVAFKQSKYNIVSNNALGVYHKDLKELAKEIKGNDELALELFDTGIYEARLLCSKVFNVKNLTEELMEKWMLTFEN
ncbi:MAG: 3-methyladenine DNA glycosylase AlkD [Maribacter sp.]|jgi:3-methyladenine DNA glycosylase AlkD